MVPPGARCKARTKDGDQCKNPTWKGTDYCYAHRDLAAQQGQNIQANPWERLQGWWQATLRRYWPLAVVIAIILFAVWAAGAYSDITGRPAQELLWSTLRRLILERPFTEPAAEGEYLIIVTGFKDESEARHLDVATVLAEGIQAELPENLNARVAVGRHVEPTSEKEARTIGGRHRAALVLWGRYTDNLVEVRFTPLVELDTPVQAEELRIVQQSVEELAVYVNDLAAGPVRWVSLLTVGQALYLAGEHEQALACFDKALGLAAAMEPSPDPQQLAATHFYRGNAHARKGDLEQAIADYTEALRIRPDFAEAYYNRGLAHADKGDLEQAIADYTEALRIRPDFAEAYNNRGVAHADKGDLGQAIADYTEALRIRPDFAEAYYNRGLAHAGKGDLEQAIADFRRVLEVSDAPALRQYAEEALRKLGAEPSTRPGGGR